jgi:hypothetical protein
MMTVLLIAIRPLPTDDGTLYECDVIDQATGAMGTIILSDVTIRDVLIDLVDVDRAQVVWKSSTVDETE